MGKSDFDRLGSHLGLSPESIKPVSADREVDAMLNRWPTLAVGFDTFIAIRNRRIELSREQGLHQPERPDSLDFRDISAS